MREPIDLTVRPTPDQLARFRALSPEDRFRWYTGLLRTTHGLASAEAKEGWRAHKQAQAGGFVSVVCAFVRALDDADFVDAASCLSPHARYHTGSAELRGAEAIIGAYATTHAWGTRTIDRVRYRSRVEAVRPGVVLVLFDDHLEHRGERHRYHCHQEMTVGRSKLVERIIHREVEGQRPALDAFFAAVGIERPR